MTDAKPQPTTPPPFAAEKRATIPAAANGSAWHVVASNHAWLATLRPHSIAGGAEYDPVKMPKVIGLEQSLGPLTGEQPTTIDTLAQWIAPLLVPKPCADCEGSGVSTWCRVCNGEGSMDVGCHHDDCDDTHQHQCSVCKGTGKGKPGAKDAPSEPCEECNGVAWCWPMIEAQVAGATVDVAKLWQVIEAVPLTLPGDRSASIVIGRASNDRHAQLVLRGDGWMLGLMPLRSGEPGAPVWPAREPE